jgi:uncharacterized protein YqeY
MPLNKQIQDDLTKAIKAKDELRVSCIRMLKTAMKNKQVELGRELKEDEVHAIISSLVRKGKEAVDGFRGGGREDLALKEEREIELLYEYLPRQLTDEEIQQVLVEIIAELPDKSPKNLGAVMKAAMVKMAGQAEGKKVNEIARKLLS